MFLRLGAAIQILLLSSCGFDWSLPSPPDDTTPSTSSDAPGGSSSSTGQAGSSSSTSSPTSGTTTGGASPTGSGGGGAGSTGTGVGGTGGAEKDGCVECADNYVALCCDDATCVSEVHQALEDPSHVLAWQSDPNCYAYDGALACAACNELCVFQCGDYFPNGYCFDDTWCE